MIYFDTAYLSKCYLHEPGSEVVRELASASGRIACCEIGRVELNAVFHRHFREGNLTADQLQVLFAQFTRDEVDSLWQWLPLTAAVLKQSADRFHRLDAGMFVRAADAIHLTCARESGFPVVHTNGRHMLSAAPAFGIEGRNIL